MNMKTMMVLTMVVGFCTQAAPVSSPEANLVVEIPFQADRPHANPFTEVEFDVLFTDPRGTQMTVPGFWAGADQWTVRYASPIVGTHRYMDMDRFKQMQTEETARTDSAA